jgi:hypothetical protein
VRRWHDRLHGQEHLGHRAALDVVTPLFIPDRFTLINPTDQLKRPCHVAWRRERRIGIAFD